MSLHYLTLLLLILNLKVEGDDEINANYLVECPKVIIDGGFSVRLRKKVRSPFKRPTYTSGRIHLQP